MLMVGNILRQAYGIMNKEAKVVILMGAALILLILVIRSLPSMITIILNPIRLLLFLSLLGIIYYMVKNWLDEENDHHDDLV